MTQKTQKSGNAPAFIAYHVPDRRNAPWIRIGAAWGHKDGEGFSLRVEMIPLDVFKGGELNILLRQPDPKDEADNTLDEADQDSGE
jgi:hypothetical protein